jgi:hypothetical protein
MNPLAHHALLLALLLPAVWMVAALAVGTVLGQMIHLHMGDCDE